MASPSIRSIDETVEGAGALTHTVTMPPTISAGDLLLWFGGWDGTGGTITDPSPGWTLLTPGGIANGTACTCRIWARIADGTEDGTTDTFATTNVEDSISHVLAIQDWSGDLADIELTSATGNDLNPDPPALTPSYGAADQLWLVYVLQNTGAAIFGTAPTGYTVPTGGSNQGSGGGGGVSSGVVENPELADTTENPSNFVSNVTAEWITVTLAVPAAISSPLIVSVGTATETDSVVAVTRRKSETLGMAAETDSVVTVTGQSTVTLGTATETDEAFAVPRVAAPSATYAEDYFPIVSVWQNIGPEYALVGSIMVYESLEFEPRFLEAGTWEMTMPYDGTALAVRADRLYTIDWREGSRTTWCLDRFVPSSTTGEGPLLTVGGPSALSILGRELAWPRPTVGLGLQDPLERPPLVAGDNAETVVRNVIEANYITRAGGLLALEPNTNLGGPVKARPKFDNLLEFATRKARHGGIGIDVNLVNTSSTRAVLTLQIWEPADKTLQVRLSEKVGNLLNWEQNNTAPTLTKAIVTGAQGGAERQYEIVTTPESQQAAADWGGHRVGLVQGPASYDTPDLVQAGEEALKEGARVTNVALEASDTPGLQAFRDYNVGDRVTAQLSTGLDIQDVISSINVTVNGGYPEITPTFGNPNAKEPMVEMAELVRHMSRRIRLLEQRS